MIGATRVTDDEIVERDEAAGRATSRSAASSAT
jgi:hypothetical protein